MSERKAISYSEVKKAVGEGSVRVWEQIGEITGAGHLPVGDIDRTIDLVGVSDAKRKQVENLLAKNSEDPKEKNVTPK